MLRIRVQLASGEFCDIKNALTVTLNSDLDVPADDLEFTVPYSSKLSGVSKITAFDGDRLVFEGNTDEIVTACDKSGAVVKLAARSLAGALLDNEAQPVTYVNPAAGFIFERHLKPFGIKSFDGDNIPFYGSLRIEKGMTQWQVFESFCRSRYGCAPRITGSGEALMRGAESKQKAVFGDGHIPYFSLREYKKPCALIDEVRLRLDEFGGYSGSIKNKNPDCRGVRRVRYVNALSDRTTVKTADKMIENSNKNSYSLLLECSGCRLDIMGKQAEVLSPLFGKKSGMRVARLRYTLDKSGELTTVLLKKEKF